jgi:hypothetical protein
VQQAAAQGLGDQQVVAAEPDGGDPAQQVVGQGGDDQPGRVGQEDTGGQWRSPAPSLRSRMDQLADGVAAVVDVHQTALPSWSVTKAW